MKNILALLSFIFMVSCCSTHIKYTDVDSSLIFQQNDKGEIWLSSMNSSNQINITEKKYEGDTLIIGYRRGAFCSSNNIIPLKADTKYLKCANKLYMVERDVKGFKITETK